MKQAFDTLSETKIGVVALLSPALLSNVHTIPAIQVEQRRSSSLTNDLEDLERSLALSYFSPQTLSEGASIMPVMEDDTMNTSIASLPHDEQVVTARVVSDEMAPFAWVDDEPDLEDEIFVFNTPTVRQRAHVVRVIEKPMVFFEDEPLCEDENAFPPLEKHQTASRVIVRASTLHNFEPDEDKTGC